MKISVWCVPGAKKTQVMGTYQNCIKIQLAAPPIDKEANIKLIEFIAKEFGVKNRAIRICSGDRARKKILEIDSPLIIPSWSIV